MSSDDPPAPRGSINASHYEVRVRGALSPALLEYLRPGDGTNTFRQHTFTRLVLGSKLDLLEIVGVLAASGVEVHDVRRCSPPTP